MRRGTGNGGSDLNQSDFSCQSNYFIECVGSTCQADKWYVYSSHPNIKEGMDWNKGRKLKDLGLHSTKKNHG
jgi:hypothetical protein